MGKQPANLTGDHSGLNDHHDGGRRSSLKNDDDDIMDDDISIDSGTTQEGREEGSEYSSGSSGLQGLSREKQEQIAKNESRALFWMRVFLFLVLVGAAVGVAVPVHNYLAGAEIEEFHSQFESDAAKVLEGVADSFDNTLGSCDEFALKLVSHARFANMTWPFVTLPDYAVQGMKLIKKANAFWMALFPIVQAAQREDWQKFASENDGWVAESIEIHANDPDYKATLAPNFTVSYEMYGFGGIVEEPHPLSNNQYLPSWQDAPTIPLPVPYNYDAWQDPLLAPDLAHIAKSKRVLIASPFQNVVFDPEDPFEAAITPATIAWASNYLGPDENPNEPTSAIGYPIIDRVDSVRLDVEEDEEDLPLVGFLNFQVFWRDMIKDILPPNSKGLVLVVETECLNRHISYQIDGPTTTFMGVGDLHDPKYDDMRISQYLSDLMSTSNPNRESAYTGLPLDVNCQKILNVYPSQAMEDEYITNRPAVFTAAVALIFIFTSLVFLVYDALVAYRQKVVMKRALASDAIVSSLFPKKVRQQLYDENTNKKNNEKESNLKEFLNYSNSKEGDGGAGARKGHFGTSRPIADEFEETTVFFADIAGFTAWSSKRKPTEVFELLEAVYGEFDKIAKRRGVFKVETIGDCYVAVTGIPEAQDDHAIRMVKFAQDCMVKMSLLITSADLMDHLGSDTADLKMRVGLHSGSTTAGVLRGDKGRFQLFGDTVNTASRMESNGIAGRIHVSQVTADALILKGKASWVTPRKDKIAAKGLGLLQTYFIVMGAEGENKSIMTSTLIASAPQQHNGAATTSSTTSSSEGSNKDENGNTKLNFSKGDDQEQPLD